MSQFIPVYPSQSDYFSSDIQALSPRSYKEAKSGSVLRIFHPIDPCKTRDVVLTDEMLKNSRKTRSNHSVQNVLYVGFTERARNVINSWKLLDPHPESAFNPVIPPTLVQTPPAEPLKMVTSPTVETKSVVEAPKINAHLADLIKTFSPAQLALFNKANGIVADELNAEEASIYLIETVDLLKEEKIQTVKARLYELSKVGALTKNGDKFYRKELDVLVSQGIIVKYDINFLVSRFQRETQNPVY